MGFHSQSSPQLLGQKKDAVEKKQQPEFQRSGKEGTNLLVFFFARQRGSAEKKGEKRGKLGNRAE